MPNSIPVELHPFAEGEAMCRANSPAPEDIVGRALRVESNTPIIRRIALTSGGGDSTVLAHRCQGLYDDLAHIDTGTALPGVRQFVEDFAKFVNKPLIVVEARDAYRRMVLGSDEWWKIYERHRQGGETPDSFRERISKLPTREERMAMGATQAPLGFPGPAGHRYAYQRLKERQLERLLRNVKETHRSGKAQKQRVALYSGVRIAESARRKMTTTAQGEWERRGNQVWVSPLIYWSNDDMRAYRRQHSLPVSDVTALVHRSGECNCLAFAARGEREEIISLWPEWYRENIQPLEQAAKERGLKHYEWGWGAGPLSIERPEYAGTMCTSCDSRLDETLV